jgi:hypothetical protein
MTEAEKAELEYLRYFFSKTDFGPAHEDVVDIINEGYTGTIPAGYEAE